MKKEFPILYDTTASGKIKEWHIWVVEEKGMGVIYTEYGLEEGKKTLIKKEIEKGKNIGKKNETTPFEQAVVEANAKWNKQKDRGNVENKKDLSTIHISPMLAKEYTKDKNKIKYPAFTQRKLDGVRCFASLDKDGNVILVSRTGKEFYHMNHIRDEIKGLLKNSLYLDGELFNPDITFENIVSIVRKELELTPVEAKEEKQIQYHVYDYVDLTNMELTFEERISNLNKFFKKTKKLKYIHLLDTDTVDNEEELMKIHKKYMKEKYEGTMIRNKEGKYKFGPTRSNDLIKLKDTQDTELKIINYTEGEGTEKGLIMFVCEIELNNGTKTTITIRPKGTKEQRSEWFKKGKSFINKYLTVKYQEKTDDGNLRFPVGITVRDYE